MSRSYTKGWMAGKGSRHKQYKKFSNRRFRQAGKTMLDDAPTTPDATFCTRNDRKQRYYLVADVANYGYETEVERFRKLTQK